MDQVILLDWFTCYNKLFDNIVISIFIDRELKYIHVDACHMVRSDYIILMLINHMITIVITCAIKISNSIALSSTVTPYDPAFMVPGDGNLYGLSTGNMTQFFRCMGLDDRIVLYLKKKRLDGRSFGKLSDSEMEEFNISNPIIMYFRDRSKKKKNVFML